MGKKTKEEKRYIIINIILLLIILTLIVYIYLLIKKNRETIITGYEYSVNVIVSTLEVEKNNTEVINASQNKESIVVTIDKDAQSND